VAVWTCRVTTAPKKKSLQGFFFLSLDEEVEVKLMLNDLIEERKERERQNSVNLG
jgi:hypothetical protein